LDAYKLKPRQQANIKAFPLPWKRIQPSSEVSIWGIDPKPSRLYIPYRSSRYTTAKDTVIPIQRRRNGGTSG